METKKYLKLMEDIQTNEKKADGKAWTSANVENLDTSVSNIQDAIVEMKPEEVSKLKEKLIARIETETDPDLLQTTKNALGYLEFYSKYNFTYSPKQQEQFKQSDWQKSYEEIEFGRKKDGLIYFMIDSELRLNYEQILKETGCNHIYTDVYNNDATPYPVSLLSLTPYDLRYHTCGWITYQEFGGFSSDRDVNKAYKNTCDSIKMFKELKKSFEKVSEQKEFKGLFRTYNEDEIDQITSKALTLCENEIKSLEKYKKECSEFSKLNEQENSDGDITI